MEEKIAAQTSEAFVTRRGGRAERNELSRLRGSEAVRRATATGSSVQFYFLILIGYLFGIASKAIKLSRGIATPGYVWFFYILNSLIVAAGIAVWFRNRRLDRTRQSAE